MLSRISIELNLYVLESYIIFYERVYCLLLFNFDGAFSCGAHREFVRKIPSKIRICLSNMNFHENSEHLHLEIVDVYTHKKVKDLKSTIMNCFQYLC